MKCKKLLAYLKITIKNDSHIFDEVYTFVKPSILYLPYNLVLNVCNISNCKITISVKNLNTDVIETKTLHLNCDNEVKFIIKNSDEDIIVNVKLCDIKTLKPCCK